MSGGFLKEGGDLYQFLYVRGRQIMQSLESEN